MQKANSLGLRLLDMFFTTPISICDGLHMDLTVKMKRKFKYHITSLRIVIRIKNLIKLLFVVFIFK